jgi:hypothetical protein
MAWARVDDGWWCHPKVMNLDLASKGLWITALSWSCAQRKDVVPDAFLRMIAATNDEANALVRAGLWVATDDGYQIHDWAVYQDMSLSEKRAEAGRKGGIRSGEVRSQGKQTGSNDQPKAEAGTHPIPSLPIPTPPDPTPAKRRTQAPTDFPVSPRLLEWVTERGLTINVSQETHRFLDHHRAKGSKFIDWDAAWRNWMTRAQEFHDRDNPPTTGGGLNERWAM